MEKTNKKGAVELRLSTYQIKQIAAIAARETVKLLKEEQLLNAAEDDWMTIKEAAAYTGYAVATLRKKASRGEIPYTRRSGHPRFLKAQLSRFMRYGNAGMENN